MCESVFKTLDIFISHLKTFHGIPSIYKFKCKQHNCRQKFQNIHSFRRHLSKHLHNITENESQELDSINIEKSNTELRNINLHVVDTTPVSYEPLNLNVDYLSEIKNSVLNFSLQLHNRIEFTRKDVIQIQNSVTDFITKPISNMLKSVLSNANNSESSVNINDLIVYIAQPFSEIESEYKFIKKLQNELLYKTPTTFLISNNLSEVIINGIPIICPNKVEGCLMDINFQIKRYFETGDILSETLTNMDRLKSSIY